MVPALIIKDGVWVNPGCDILYKDATWVLLYIDKTEPDFWWLHPSLGNPSTEDIMVTDEIAEECEVYDLR